MYVCVCVCVCECVCMHARMCVANISRTVVIVVVEKFHTNIGVAI